VNRPHASGRLWGDIQEIAPEPKSSGCKPSSTTRRIADHLPDSVAIDVEAQRHVPRQSVFASGNISTSRPPSAASSWERVRRQGAAAQAAAGAAAAARASGSDPRQDLLASIISLSSDRARKTSALVRPTAGSAPIPHPGTNRTELSRSERGRHGSSGSSLVHAGGGDDESLARRLQDQEDEREAREVARRLEEEEEDRLRVRFLSYDVQLIMHCALCTYVDI